MASLQPLLRKSSQLSVTLRSFATTAQPSHHNDHNRNHKFLEPCSFIGSWEAPKNPKEAEARLAQLRRDYAKQVKEVRKAYIQEMELMRLEKQRKDDARREAIRVANEERKKLKAEVAKVKAEERKIAQEEFRQTLVCVLSSFLFLESAIVRMRLVALNIGLGKCLCLVSKNQKK